MAEATRMNRNRPWNLHASKQLVRFQPNLVPLMDQSSGTLSVAKGTNPPAEFGRSFGRFSSVEPSVEPSASFGLATAATTMKSGLEAQLQ